MLLARSAQRLRERHDSVNLKQILRAGEWVSPAFLRYLDTVQVDRDSVVQAHVQESESEEE